MGIDLPMDVATPDPYDLNRFVSIQNYQGTYSRVVEELRGGLKKTHWMWFIFPQIQGLGTSAMAQKFAIYSEEEAQAYCTHEILGSRLVECTRLVLNTQDRSAVDILGGIDAQKLHSCMTLFRLTCTDQPLFGEVLQRFFAGRDDQGTVRMLRHGE